jgi:hypothetical protein
MANSVPADVIHDTISLPPFFKDPTGYMTRDQAMDLMEKDWPPLVDLEDFQTAVAIARRLDLYEQSLTSPAIWGQSLSWLDRYTAVLDTSDAVLEHQLNAMRDRILEIWKSLEGEK